MRDEDNYWDSDYSNGSTRPPKSHAPLIAALLSAVILIAGGWLVLNFMDISLLPDSTEDTESTDALSFTSTESASPSSDALLEVPAESRPDAEVPLSSVPGSSDNYPQEGGLSLQEIYLKCIDSVVSITCTLSGGTASGTGVILSEDGYIVTNQHVVEDALSIRVKLTSDAEYTASVVGEDVISDLAVLYIDADALSPAEFGDSSTLRVGDAVVAIGDPLGEAYRGTMTDGIVSAINRDVEVDGRTMTLIQTNAALNSGNSGGPLINCYGQVIGICNMKIGAFSDSAGVEGIGFAIPSVTVLEIAQQLMEQGYVSGRPSLGLSGEEISEMYQRFYNLPAGYLVEEVESGGAADAAGLAAGDVILYIGDTRIESSDDLNSALYSYEAGDTVTITYYRGNRQHTVQLTLQEAGG
ncbi:MAG: trypsin-like peptidase domain-containing protein [Firmicutes bacterium]|nr:trypsin-like peptidase domain-containing protein [Bacillota bacterium]